MAILIQQDYQQSGDTRGMRSKVKPQDIGSGTLYGQYQLRGSILALKDSQEDVSGYIAFGTDMTTIPTSPTTGTGILIDYSGVYGNNGGVKQFYLQSSDGKAYAAGGKVLLDVGGIKVADPADAITFYTAAFAQTTGNITRNSRDLFLGSLGTSATAPSGVNLHAQESGGKYADFWLSIDPDPDETWATLQGYDFTGLLVSATAPPSSTNKPSSLLHLQSTAPALRMEDTTSSAKSLLLTVDANKAIFKEVAGSDLLGLDLSNNRLGIGTSSPAETFEVNTANNNQGMRLVFTGTSAAGAGPQAGLFTNDGAAMANNDRIGQFAFGGYNGSAVVPGPHIIAQTTEAWSTTARGSKLTFFTVPNTTTSIDAVLTLNQDKEADFTGNVDVASGKVYKVNGTQVLAARDTGWTAMTGTANENSTYDTATVTLAQLAGRVMALQAALTTHGLIGA